MGCDVVLCFVLVQKSSRGPQEISYSTGMVPDGGPRCCAVRGVCHLHAMYTRLTAVRLAALRAEQQLLARPTLDRRDRIDACRAEGGPRERRRRVDLVSGVPRAHAVCGRRFRAAAV